MSIRSASSRYPDLQPQAFPHPPITQRLYRNIAVTFFILTIIVVGVALWMSAVRATVRVHVKRAIQPVEASVEIAKNPEQGQLQGRVVEGAFDRIQEFGTTSEVVTSSANLVSHGRIRIVNSYSKAQALVKTTRLLTADGRLFRINATVNVPSGQSLEVEAYSDQPGVAMIAGEKLTIPGLWIDLQKWIYAESVTPFVGDQKAVKAVTSDDISKAETTLQVQVVDDAKAALMTEAGLTAEKLADDCTPERGCWRAIYLVGAPERKTNAVLGQQTDKFLAQVKVKVTAVYYPKKDMESLLVGKIKERLPEGRELVDFDQNRVTYKLESADVKAEKSKITISVDAASRLTAQSPALSKESIAGQTVEEAKKKLGSVDGVDFVEITLRPSWAHKIPSQKDKIEMVIE